MQKSAIYYSYSFGMCDDNAGTCNGKAAMGIQFRGANDYIDGDCEGAIAYWNKNDMTLTKIDATKVRLTMANGDNCGSGSFSQKRTLNLDLTCSESNETPIV